MFSGIIEELGVVKSIMPKGNIIALSVIAEKAAQEIKRGDSIAVNGVCLTVINSVRDNGANINKGMLSFELLNATVRDTNLGKLKVCEKVNLERALKLGDRLSGHFVSGHIDCLGIIRKKAYFSGNLCFEIAVPKEFSKYIIPKGSIAVDGISLTVAIKRADTFSIFVIPHTLKNTTLGFRNPSGRLNIEFDILAKRAP